MSTQPSKTVRRPQYARVPIPHRPVHQRVEDFDEVALTYRDDEAVVEAQRCLQCYRPACEQACPNHNPIKTFIRLVAEGRPEEAAELLWPHNPLPSCTGRVCAWERQCEGACPLARKGEPIAIGALERYLAEKALARHREQLPSPPRLSGPWPSGPQAIERGDVAVIGAGPAGIACANTVARAGLRVTVLDRWLAPGGVMSYGIPEFVLPKASLAAELARLRGLGIRFVQQVTVGRDLTLEDLWKMGFRAIFVAIGANEAARAGIPGEHLQGVVSAKEFLMDVATRQLLAAARGEPDPYLAARPLSGRRVVVIGAGNTAMDAARTARRLGAQEVTVLYRRAREHSPSRPVEMALAEEEGVQFRFLVNPTRFEGAEGRLQAVELVRMQPGPPDASGRPTPVPVEGSEHWMPADLAILAVGYRVEPDLPSSTPGLATASGGRILVRDRSGATTLAGVWAGGDCVTGPNTVVHAIAAGRQAGEAIVAYLKGS